MLNFYRSLRRFFVAALVVIVLVIAYTAYIAIGNVVAEQSRLQQESTSPVFSLVTKELLKPLHTAQAIANSKLFHELMSSDSIDEDQMFSKLKTLEGIFDLVFFTASERSRTQYFSDGTTLKLEEGKVAWYFQALDQPEDVIADLGDVDNVHLFFDIKIYDEDNDLLGIVGTGKSMQHFLDLFETYKKQYGYDFIFMNAQNKVMLSSIEELLTKEGELFGLQELPWYEQVSEADDLKDSLNSELVNIDDRSFLLSEIRLEVIEWRLLMLLPLDARQAEINSVFIKNTVIILAVFSVLVIVVIGVLTYFRRSIEQQMEIDHLSQLPNRAYVERKYEELQRQNTPVSVVVVDVDHFKSINDTYGHNVGDRVIQEIGQILALAVRDNDVAGRWGGEEFILLLPKTPLERAVDVAERTRRSLATANIQVEEHTLHVTASFGVSFGSMPELTDLVDDADTALYEAKSGGRNKVVSFENDGKKVA